MTESTFIVSPACSQGELSLSFSSSIQTHTFHKSFNGSENKATILWLDANDSKTDPDCRNFLNELHHVADDIHAFSNADACIDFLTEITEQTQKLVLIVSDVFSKGLVPLIADWPQLHAIFLFGKDSSKCKEWYKDYSKVKGMFSEINALIKSLEQIIDPESLTMIDIIEPSNIGRDRLHCSFMYSQLFKEVLLELHRAGMGHRHSFVEYCRQHSSDVISIENFNSDYADFSPMYWYSAFPFLYQTVNRALRTLDVDLILTMSFFIGDLHKELEQLHSDSAQKNCLTVYRGQR